jgi:hypothetical protein
MAALTAELIGEGMVKEMMKQPITMQEGRTNLHIALAGQLIKIFEIKHAVRQAIEPTWLAQPSVYYF